VLLARFPSQLGSTLVTATLCAFDLSFVHTRVVQCKGLWRGVGEPPLRGLYNVLASSSIGHHQFREEASTRSARIFGPAVSTSDLPNEAVFSSRPSSAASSGKFQTIRRARREAGTRPRSPRFKWRAGTPHPPLHHWPSGAESTTMNGSSRALMYVNSMKTGDSADKMKIR
jgi:hypothetical protein